MNPIRKPRVVFWQSTACCCSFLSIILIALPAKAWQVPTEAKTTQEFGDETDVPSLPGEAQETVSSQSIDQLTPAQYRLQKLLQLQFNRGTAAYLRAWSQANLPDEPIEEPEKSETAETQPAETKPDEASVQVQTGDDAKPAEEVKPKIPPELMKLIDQEVAQFHQAVLLGKWNEVRDYLQTLPEKDGGQVYTHVLKSVATPGSANSAEAAQTMQMRQMAAQIGVSITPILSPNDILGLADAAPQTPAAADLKLLSQLLRTSAASGNSLESFYASLKTGTRFFGGEEKEKRQAAAEFLVNAGRIEAATEFLPDQATALIEANVEQLLLIHRHRDQSYSADRKPEQLEALWELTQSMLGLENLKSSQREMLLEKAVELSTRVREELGQEWLKQSFTDDPHRGVRILSTMGTSVAENMISQFQDPGSRLNHLELQNSAVESLLESAPDLAIQWQETLNVLLQNWMKEADLTLKYASMSSGRPQMRLDVYGNYYWGGDDNEMQMQMRGQNQRIRPIEVNEMLRIQPGEKWQRLIAENLQVHFSELLAKLHLKNVDDEAAFPYIENVCRRDPHDGRALTNEFLNAWIRNHDPNSSQRDRNPYIYMYGYDLKADAIPLTRSKQQRNLAELKTIIDRIRALPIEPLDDKLLARAFTTCHSEAEVYQLESFENVFGSIDSLAPDTIAGVAHTMRENLAGKWRSVKLQEQMQTKRKAPEIQQEVVNGYLAALRIVDQSLRKHPENWQLTTARACLLFDQNAYDSSVQKSSEFSDRRDRAFACFRKAAEQYQAIVGSLPEEQHSIDVYQRWFYASLGACDVRQITHETVADSSQFPLIRAEILRLPGELAEQHLARFANDLFTRMSPLQPQVKFRYLDGGFAIVGEHPRALEAKKVYEYYRDLVTEIQLEIAIDGTERVGHDQPFGLFVNLRHTPEIERESGGFDKYVQNQNQMRYSYNYGRPTEDYRDKFQEATNTALQEQFEVLSIIFEDPKTMKSREAGEGWRVTPYAYVLLKARGAQVDKIPSLKLDLDFLDTSGYAVLPIESQMIPIVCNKNSDPRPVADLEIVQTLDERRASEGKLILEIKATATGLVPPLAELLDLKFPGFELVHTDDQSVVPTKFDETANEIQIKSDRSWTIELAAKEREQASEFQFCLARLNGQQTFQRYQDADLVEVSQSVPLENAYATPTSLSAWLIPVLIACVVLILMVSIAIVLLKRRPASEQRFTMPAELNPFTVLGLLRDINTHARLKPNEKEELVASIRRLESYYFEQRTDAPPPNLGELTSNWLAKAC
jgi:hypothetical protein